MAVYTHCSEQEISAFLREYSLGELVAARPIAEGVENSNYLLITRKQAVQHRYILTLYEKRVQLSDLPFFLNLKEYLTDHQRSCPLPMMADDGVALRTLNGRPAAIFSFLEGQGVKRITNVHVRALGEELARLHCAVVDFPQERANSLAPDMFEPLYRNVCDRLDRLLPDLSVSLGAAVQSFACWQDLGLPRGVIHADMFPDNVFFIDEYLSGVIDFYFACTDYYAYDLAICLNAWCFERGGDFNVTKAQCLLRAYHAVRPLTQAEMELLPLMAQAAAVRFLLTRANDWFYPVKGAVVTPKDPMEYVRKWQFHSQITHYKEYGL